MQILRFGRSKCSGAAVLGLSLASLTLAGCATGPDPEVVQARDAVQAARNDPLVEEHAPVALREAEQALVRVEQAEKQGADEEEVDHLAYLATQEAEISRALAVEQLSQQQIAAVSEQIDRELQELRAQRTDRGVVITLEDVLFEVNGADLRPGAQAELIRLADYLEQHPDRNVLIEGHTDSTGSSDYNLQLSQLRAESVRAYLVGNGVPAQQIRAIGYGETRPEAPDDTAAGRQQNRRVEIVILDAGESFAEAVRG
jgi:outer membrane protein OmpA-like peptidoglycan-associated protein